MEKVKAIIVDDEELARENLRLMLEEFCPEVEIIGIGENVDEARELIKSKSPEAVFLDIRMPSGEEGLELLDEVDNYNFQIVFVTAFKDYAIKAFNANSIHYILKPIDIEDLQEAVGKLVEYKNLFKKDPENFDVYLESIKNFSENLHYQKASNKITVSHSKGIKIIEDDTILYIEGDGNCSNLHFVNGGNFLDTRTLKIYESILNKDKFYRIHKKYLINLDHLSEYLNEDGYFAILTDGTRLTVARARVSDFVQRLKGL